MTNLSKTHRDTFSAKFDTSLPEIVNIATSTDESQKYVLRLHDGSIVEMVTIPTAKKITLCISTQVGCMRGCSFCATAGLGFMRQMSTAEIVSQYVLASLQQSKPITNIVFMGMGEPLDNFDNVISTLEILTDHDGFRFSGRRITLSTSGVVPQIMALAEKNINLKLAISLNSAIDSKRDKIMPINRTYPLPELKRAILSFRKKSNFRITIEYIMIANWSMADEDIAALMRFCGDISCKVNLIRYNEIPDSAWKSPTDAQVESFINKLNRLSVAVTYRKSRGGDIAGACGQLAGKNEH
jgi:23S rRNA (adenine2503-C2)-methyltransferase